MTDAYHEEPHCTTEETWKCKLEASRFPKCVKAQESVQRYTRVYRANLGIQLNATNFSTNPKTDAKLCLKSFWSKFAESHNRTQPSLVRDKDQFLSLCFSEKYEINHFHFLSDQIAVVQWKCNKSCVVPHSKVNNAFIAAFPAAWAPLPGKTAGKSTLTVWFIWWEKETVLSGWVDR